MFRRVNNENGCFEHFCYKKTAISFFVCEYPFLSLIEAKIRFCMLATKSRCFEFLVTKKKSVFAFSLLKRVRLITENMFWFVSCNIGLFSVLLHQKKGLLPVCRESTWFSLDFTQTTVFSFFWLLRCLRIVFLRTTLFSVSVTKPQFGRPIPKKCFGLLAT